MSKLNKLIISFLGMAVLFFSYSTVIIEASELKFSVEPILPENQINQEHTYFDLIVEPDQKQTVKVHMRNDTNQDIFVVPHIEAATTNINGVVEYGESNSKLDKTAPYNIADLVKAKEKEVKIPANNSYDLEIEIKMPKEKFEGVLAGGITLQEKDEPQKENKSKKQQGLAIENKYAYVVAIILQENLEELTQTLTLDKVVPSQVNARNTINATLKNREATYINQLSVETKITKKGDKSILYSSEKEGMQMAPNTSFAYPIFLDGKKLKPGKYTLDMKVKSAKQGWEFTKEFEVEPEVAKRLNASDVTIEKDNYLWLYSTVTIVIVILLVSYLLIKNKKNKKNEN
ncbi:MAG: DUF916 and DUF3324 domain-containing protein [Enterococcus durans]